MSTIYQIICVILLTKYFSKPFFLFVCDFIFEVKCLFFSCVCVCV